MGKIKLGWMVNDTTRTDTLAKMPGRKEKGEETAIFTKRKSVEKEVDMPLIIRAL